MDETLAWLLEGRQPRFRRSGRTARKGEDLRAPSVPVPALMDGMERVVYSADLDLTIEQVKQYAVEWEAAGFVPHVAREWLHLGARVTEAGVAARLREVGLGFKDAFLSMKTPGGADVTNLFQEVRSGRLTPERARAIIQRVRTERQA